MANYYTRVAFRIPVRNDEEYKFLAELVELAVSFEDWEEHKRTQLLSEIPEYEYFVTHATTDICIARDGDNAHVYNEEATDPWSFGIICQLFLRKFRPDEALAFSWADRGDSPEADSPQGGGIFVTPAAIHCMNTLDVRRAFMHQTGFKACNTVEGY